MTLGAPFTAIDRRGTMKLLLGGYAVSMMPGGFALAATRDHPDDGLVRARPEDENIDPLAILAFLAELEQRNQEMHSFMLARNGKVVAEGYWTPYRPELPHMTHSLTKSVTASGVGIAIAEGRFGLRDKVVSFFDAELPPVVSENLAMMTVEDLLTQRTGHEFNVSGSVWRPIKTSWVAEFFKIPVVFKPGTKFVYTSASTYMLSAILTKTTGLPTFDYMKPRFFEPLGIRDAEWEVGPNNITPGANGLSWKVSDSMKLGLVHQQGGQWQGRQVIPRDWVDAVHQPHVPGVYGYQWWLGPEGRYAAHGLFGQYAYVYPNHGAVLAVMSATGERRDGWSAILEKHFPAMFGAGPMQVDPAGDEKLRATTRALRIKATLGAPTSSTAAAVSGRRFDFDPNEDAVRSIRLDFTSDRCTFTLVDDRGEHKVACGLGSWVEGHTSMTGNKLHHEYQPDSMRVTAGAGWTAPDTLEMVWMFNETAFRDHVTLKFAGDRVTYDRRVNVNSAARERPTLVGRRV